MFKLRYITFVVLFIFSVNSFSNNEATQKKIKTSFNDAEWYFMEGDYTNARILYEELVKIDKTNSNYNYKLGITILFDIENTNDELVEKYLAVAVKNTTIDYKNSYKEKAAPIDANVFYGDVLRYAYKFDEAIKSYENYLQLTNGKKEEFTDYVNREIKNCNTAKKLLSTNESLKNVELGPKIITKNKTKSFPLISTDQTVSVFAYGENNSTFGNINYELEDDNYKTDDIYFSVKENGVWSKPLNITTDLKIKHQALPVSISADGETLFLVQDDNDDGNIYVSNYIDNKWTPIKKLNKNINSKKWETHASITNDGRTLYFTSDRKGGEGGFDIYYSKIDKDGNWGKAVNLGKTINTKYDEDLPFVGADNTLLYFCSQGHENIGGYDIFESKIENGKFLEPNNVGFVLNSPRNDLFYVANEGNKFTFSKLAKDESVVIEEAPELVSVYGIIKNSSENDSLKINYTIQADSSALINLQKTDSGFTFSSPKQNNNYVITADGYKDTTINLELADYNGDSKELTIELEKINKGGIIATNSTNTIENSTSEISNMNSVTNSTNNCVLFDFNSSKIKGKFKNYLNTIIENSNNKTIEIYAYTDKKGTTEYNYKLSKQRAEAVKKYLVKNGALNTNIILKPKGETTKFDTDSLNRRAEITISTINNNSENSTLKNISEDFILFDFDKYNLSENAKTKINNTIKKLTKQNSITIVAYTDPKGTEEYNKMLSVKRAEAVKKYIISKGYADTRIKTQGKGIMQNNSDNYLKRRAEIIIE